MDTYIHLEELRSVEPQIRFFLFNLLRQFLPCPMLNVSIDRELLTSAIHLKYSASHSQVAPENVGLQKEQKYTTFACHTCNEVLLCFVNSQKGSWQHEKIR
jgi:hypothetical protein